MLAFTSSSYCKYLKIMSGAWGYAIYYSTDGKSYSRYGHTGFTANSATLELSSQDLDSISDIEPVWIMKKASLLWLMVLQLKIMQKLRQLIIIQYMFPVLVIRLIGIYGKI